MEHRAAIVDAYHRAARRRHGGEELGRIIRPARRDNPAKIGNVALLLLFVLMVALNFRALIGVIGSGAILAALLFFTALFVLGWLSGGSHRGVLGLATTARNFGAALAPAENCFDDPKVTVMIIVGAIVCLVVSFVAAGWLRRNSATPVCHLPPTIMKYPRPLSPPSPHSPPAPACQRAAGAPLPWR